MLTEPGQLQQTQYEAVLSWAELPVHKKMHTFFLQVSNYLFIYLLSRAGIGDHFKLVSGSLIICYLLAVSKPPSH